MEAWQTILLAIGGNAVLLAVLGWLAKSVVEGALHRDIKRFESDLKASADATIERLKSDLQVRAIEHQVRFSRLHEKQASVVADLSGLLVEALWDAESFLSLIEWNGEPNKREKHHAAMNKLAELYRFFDKHRIYLPPPRCASLEQLIKEARSHVINFGVYVRWEDESLQDHTREAKVKAWRAGWEAIRSQVPLAREKLEAEFRALLAPGV